MNEPPRCRYTKYLILASFFQNAASIIQDTKPAIESSVFQIIFDEYVSVALWKNLVKGSRVFITIYAAGRGRYKGE